jgi:hypothetical protein
LDLRSEDETVENVNHGNWRKTGAVATNKTATFVIVTIRKW